MALFEFSKKLSKYRLSRKAMDDMELDESTPFPNSSTEKVFSDSEKIDRRTKKVALFALGLIGILLAQTFKMQIIDRSKFLALAENNRLKEVTFRADRGIIYDKNKTVLVRNEAIFDLVGIGREIPEDKKMTDEIVDRIAMLTGKTKQEIGEAIGKLDRTSYRAELIAENIDVSSAIAVESEKEKLAGIEVRKNAIRSYPDAKYFSQIIAYTGRVSPDNLNSDAAYEPSDFIGKDGLEAYYEKDLRGKKGAEKAEVDAGGKVISILSKTDTEAGRNLILSIDGDLQKKLQDSLESEMNKTHRMNNAKGGAAGVALDPRSGKVLALVSLPTYDNNKFVNPASKQERDAILNDPEAPMLNRIIGGRYPPGSTIKPVMAIAALTEKIITESTIIEDNGVISFPEYGGVRNFFGWNRSGLGPVNVISAIAKSSDIFFYTIGGGFGKFIGLGVDKIAGYFKKFNLGKKLGIDLPGEADGLVPTKEWKLEKFGKNDPWVPGNTYHISIGQGYLTVTPLQVASWTEVMANKGTLYKPQLVDKITSSDSGEGEVYKEFPPVVIASNLADEKYIELARRGMREAVTNGTARSLNDLPVAVAGKTGTAQYGTKGLTHSWFTSFAPYDNPEIVLTILIEGGGEGSSTAVPIAKDILSWYFRERKTGSSVAN